MNPGPAHEETPGRSTLRPGVPIRWRSLSVRFGVATCGDQTDLLLPRRAARDSGRPITCRTCAVATSDLATVPLGAELPADRQSAASRPLTERPSRGPLARSRDRRASSLIA